MTTQYKAILVNKSIYKEILLPGSVTRVSVGTDASAEIRLPKSAFFEKVELLFSVEEDGWAVTCSPNVYLSVGSMSKLPQKKLAHGDELEVRYYSTDALAVSMSVMIDFDQVDQDYSRVVDIRERPRLRIGGRQDCDIRIGDPAIQNDVMCLSLRGKRYVLEEVHSTFGAYVNGVRVKGQCVLNDCDFFSLDKYKFFLKGSRLYTTAAGAVRAEGLQQYRDVPSQSSLIYPKFNLNTRVKVKPDTESIPVLDPPEMPTKPRDNLVATLAPALAMLMVTVLLRGMMSGSGGTYVLISACTMSIGIITSICSFFAGRKKYKKDLAQRRESYTAYIRKKREDIEAARADEKATLEEMFVDSERSLKNILGFSGGLFDRKAEDEDFLEVYVGEGPRRSVREIDYKPQEKIEVGDELCQIPAQLKEEYAQLEKAPVTIPLKDCDAVGVIGGEEECLELLKVMVLDLAARQYHTDLRMCFVADEGTIGKILWARWLPHTDNPEMGIKNIVCDSESRNLLFENLFIRLSSDEKTDGAGLRHTVVFVVDDMGLKNHPLSAHIQGAGGKGAHFVFFSRDKEHLPEHCAQILRLTGPDGGERVDAADGRQTQPFRFSPVPGAAMERIAFKLAPVYCDEISLESSLTRSYSFFQMMNIFAAEDIDLERNWQAANIAKTMAAPLGINAKQETVFLDLHERAHGPHGLVAGTTGSGKSEILQSYILSMAIHYHPYEVGFVIIDFKGGGMANQFKNLPHLIGTITNIDGREIDRSLKSIKAELQKRQRLFAEQGVNKIDAYIQEYKKGRAQVALPHLIIVVDEFAELKADQPEFMKELISAARIGRSLGVHLILATQKPSGQVNEQIWSNSRFKLCLKVQTQEDSKEVLKSPLAAEIREPGRAYLQVGNNEVFELFQSAYSGENANVDESGGVREFDLKELNTWGKERVVYRQTRKKTPGTEQGRTQLEAVVEHIARHCAGEQIEKLPSICLPALPALLPYAGRKIAGPGVSVEIGLYDDPDTQYQGSVTLNLTASNCLILGSSQYGKTNLLEVILRGLAEGYTPRQVNVYILDFGSMVLKTFEASGLVGGVVCAADDEKLRNLFRMLHQELRQRKEALSRVGVSSYAAYCEAGYDDLPQIVVMVDNFIGLRELYLSDEDDLLPLCREGLAFGITVVMTAAQSNAVGYRYRSNFAQEIVLYCNDSGEYGAVFDRCRLQPANTPGRGLIAINKTVYEFQTFLCFEGEREIDRVAAIRQHIEQCNRKASGEQARKIPEVPAVLDLRYVQNNYRPAGQPYLMPTGIDYETVEWVTIDLSKAAAITVLGRENFGQDNFLRLLLGYLQRHILDCPAKAYVIDDFDRKLADLAGLGFVEKYTLDGSELDLILEEMEAELAERQEKARRGESIDREPLLLCVLHSEDLMRAEGIKKNTADVIRRIVKNHGRLKVCFVFAKVDNAGVGYNAPEGCKLAKEARDTFLFDDLSNMKLLDVPLAEQRKHKKAVSPGDAYLITEKSIVRQKTISQESELKQYG